MRTEVQRQTSKTTISVAVCKLVSGTGGLIWYKERVTPYVSLSDSCCHLPSGHMPVSTPFPWQRGGGGELVVRIISLLVVS